MKGYKGFHKGLICRNKQYKENTVFEEPDAEICRCGMHFCANPMDVLDYYGFIGDDCTLNEFAEVESLAEAKTDDDKKFCTTKMKVGNKLSVSEFIKACVNFCCSSDRTLTKLAASGDGAKLAASGGSAKLAASGFNAKLAASGDGAKLAASGDGAKLAASGCNSIVTGVGANNIAKASIGSWIVLSEWAMKNGEYIPVCVKCAQVDGEKIKPDTFYKLKNGEFVEVHI